MKKLLYLFPFLLGISACAPQPTPTQDVSNIVNATLTAIAQDNPQVIAPQNTLTPISGNIAFFWPLVLPDGVVLDRENSRADADGFVLEFIDPNQGIILRLLGGTEADQYPYCVSYQNNPSEPVSVRGLEGCFPAATGGGFSVEWKENGTHYIIGGMSVSKELALTTAEHLESVDLSTFQGRLAP